MEQAVVRKSGDFFHSYVSCVHKDYLNFSSFIQSLPSRFDQGEGKVIYKGRNELREFHYEGKDLVVKSFCKPHLINRFVYGLFRSSKAQRSFEYAELFLDTYRDFKKHDFPRLKEILKAIAETTARMHEKGYWHKDYSAGNILFRDDREQIEVEVIDLNRMAFGPIDRGKGCRNFERLPSSNEQLTIIAETYAQIRGFDPKICFQLMRQYIDLEEQRRAKK